MAAAIAERKAKSVTHFVATVTSDLDRRCDFFVSL